MIPPPANGYRLPLTISPNLITLHELHAEGDLWFFTMELLDGVDFQTFVHQEPDEQTLRWALGELGRGVSELHDAGMLHRDLKPPNVIVLPGERVVLLDFGLVTEADGQRTTEANVVMGTAFGIPSGVVVDTHVRRIARRLGLTRNDQPEKIEQDLMALIPQEAWIDFGHRMIWHGRRVCTARKPACDACSLASLCPSRGRC